MMDELPPQFDLDSLAHFLQAVNDLRSSPFFTDGQSNLGVSFSQATNGESGPITFRVPDPRVRDALVVSFRRIWMVGEPANFERVANIVKRYWPQARTYVDYFRNDLKNAKAQFPPARFMGLAGRLDISISPDAVIDLWLNCRLAHVGARSGTGRFSRADYERELRAYGEAQFEYMFMIAIYHVGLTFICLVQLVERLLQRCLDSGMQPSFVFDNLNVEGRRRTDSGDLLERFTPGVTIDERDLVRKLELLCLRRQYSEISKVFGLLELSLPSRVELIQRSSNLDLMFVQMGLAVEIVSLLDQEPRSIRFATISDDLTDIGQHPWRKGMFAVCDNARVVMDGDAHPILSEQFNVLRSALISGSSGASSHG